MTFTPTLQRCLVAALLLAAPSLSEAGPPLICHPFETAGGALLPWGDGPGWNDPDPEYDVQRLTTDALRLLTSRTPVLTRMELLRRAAIYATRDARIREDLLAAVLDRASRTGSAAALFDAGYLIETYKQAAPLHGGAAPAGNGYEMVLRAIASSGGSGEMELAASLMTTRERADAHLRRARAAAVENALLARNIESQWR